MGLESGTFLNELVIANPVGSADKVDKGDDHIRLIKKLLKNSLPDVDQAVSTIIFNAVEPALKRKGTLWGDETLDLLKIRNKGNTAFITLAISMLTDNSVDVNAGTIDGATIGAASPSTGVFTSIENSPIGAVTPATGKFTTLEATGLITGAAGLTLSAGNIILAALATIDGRDPSVDGSKLDGVEPLAEVNEPIASQPEAEAGVENTKTMTSLRTDQAIEDRISGGGILQADIGAAQVGQGELKTATGDMATTSNIFVTGPGGEYGFWPTVKYGTGASQNFYVQPLNSGVSVVLGTSFLQRFMLFENGASTLTVRQRFIQASPPYDMGDGDVFSFIFALIDNVTGLVKSMYHAPDPPWANNGPTSIRPDRIDPVTGKQFKKISSIGTNKALLMNPGFIGESEIEITPAFKNSDMGLIPHPFQGNDLTGKTVVLIDPMSAIVERLEAVKNAGGDAAEFFYGNYLKIGNTELNRGRPPGVMSVSVAMK